MIISRVFFTKFVPRKVFLKKKTSFFRFRKKKVMDHDQEATTTHMETNDDDDDDGNAFDLLSRLREEREDVLFARVMTRLNPSTDLKFLFDATKRTRELVRDYLVFLQQRTKGKKTAKSLPKKFKLAEFTSRSTIAWAFEQATSANASPRMRADTFLRKVTSTNENPEVLRFVAEKREGEAQAFRNELAKTTWPENTGYCDCCERVYHMDYLVFFDRGYLKPKEFGGDGKVRCETACGTCMEKYVPVGFGHPDRKEGTDDKDGGIWEYVGFCDICEHQWHNNSMVPCWENSFTVTINGRSRRVDAACDNCFNRYAPYHIRDAIMFGW